MTKTVTYTQVLDQIDGEFYFTAKEGLAGARSHTRPIASPLRNWGDNEEPLELLTFCVLVLKNGYTVTGHAACADPESYDENIGRNVAREHALRQIWPLLGYELREKLFQETQA